MEPFWPYQAAGDRAVYQWLARRPGGAVIELPLEGWGRTIDAKVYQYRTLLHGHPTVNGVGRFYPPLPDMLSDPDSPLAAPDRMGDGVQLLRAMGVRYVLVHAAWYERRALGDALHRDPAAPVIELGWAPVSARRVRLRQTGGRTRWYWSVHELRLLAPAS